MGARGNESVGCGGLRRQEGDTQGGGEDREDAPRPAVAVELPGEAATCSWDGIWTSGRMVREGDTQEDRNLCGCCFPLEQKGVRVQGPCLAHIQGVSNIRVRLQEGSWVEESSASSSGAG